MLYAPDWQIRIGADWKTLDETTSRFLEAGFVEPSAQVVVIPGIVTAEVQYAWCNRFADADFNVDKMELVGLPVRRSENNFTSTNCEYFNDEAWVELDMYVQCLIKTALMLGRENTAIYGPTDGSAYDISLTALTLIDRATGKVYPLRISGVDNVVGVDGVDGVVDDTAHA